MKPCKTAPMSPAWMFVLQHAELIDRMSRRFTFKTPTPFDDFRQALALDVASTFDRYDPARGASPSTWIFMRARKVRETFIRAGMRNGALAPTEEAACMDVAVTPDRRTSCEASERRAELSLIVSAVEDEREHKTILTILNGWSEEEADARTGLTARGRRTALDHLRARVASA